MGIQNDVQKLEPGDKVTLFEIDATAFGGDLLRFHPHAQSEPIIWQGQPYSPWPVSVSGFSRSGETKQATPSLSVSNLDGTISAMCAALDDLVGARVLRHCTLAKYLDAANFPNGNPTADPNEEMPVELWFIEQKTADTGDEVTFELSSPLAFGGRQLPNSAITPHTCQWLARGGYRGPYCNYTGAEMFDINDQPTDDPAKDRCAGRLNSCKCRQWSDGVLNFGGFPSADLTGAR